MGRVSGRACIVTGAACGLDRAIGEALPDERADLRFAGMDGGGRIVDTASIASRQGYDGVAPCRPSQRAVISRTQRGARDLAKRDITVTGFAPGAVATEEWEQGDRDLMEIGAAERPGQATEAFAAGILEARVATRADVTPTTTFPASPESDCMTGRIVTIDGGMTLV